VRVNINLTTPACPVKEQMKGQAEQLLRALPGVKDVQVEMTAEVRGPQGPPRQLAATSSTSSPFRAARAASARAR
jgi:ATP-binding protein involved in chromosome partitioning